MWHVFHQVDQSTQCAMNEEIIREAKTHNEEIIIEPDWLDLGTYAPQHAIKNHIFSSTHCLCIDAHLRVD